MNQRIKELLIQSEVFNKDGTILKDVTGYELKKFAKLVIKECADICDKIYFDNYPDAEDFERSEEGEAIKKHFGVE